jgi:hypothetical protein
MAEKGTHNQRVSELMGRLSELDKRQRDAASTEAMRLWLRERRWVKTALEAIGPPR